MERNNIDFNKFSDSPGVYIFWGEKKNILYVGRATSLKNRIRSYFSKNLSDTRGERMSDALRKTVKIEEIKTDSVLEAYILEANLIKKNHPQYNVVDKDNKSFQFVCITKEAFPRILIVRGRNLEQGISDTKFSDVFGPFPKGSMLKEAMNVLRKIFPYRDICKPFNEKSLRLKKGKSLKCFRAQLGLCPGVCSGDIDEKEYQKRIKEIRLFFNGKKKQLIKMLEREMNKSAKLQEFEIAEGYRRRISALTHIQDVSLIKKDFVEDGDYSDLKKEFLIEAYDVAHILGKHTVGSMVVLSDGVPSPDRYRTFTISGGGNDTLSLKEMIERRLGHPEWKFPNLIVIDGGKAQKNVAEKILDKNGIKIPIVSVVKNEKHKAREILGEVNYAEKYERDILKANAEAHRFALARHRKKRLKEFLK